MTVSRVGIEQAVRVVLSKPLLSLGRAADLVWFQFGLPREELDSRGTRKVVGEYSLHLQCGWRLCDERRILVGSGDLFIDSQLARPSAADSETSLFDDRVRQLPKLSELGLVTQVSGGILGALELTFSNGYKLEVVPLDSSGEEQWRFFAPGSSTDHFVVPGVEEPSLHRVK